MPDQSVVLNKTRVKENAALKEPYIFWGGYKHHVRGMLVGTTLGAVIGAVVGCAAIPFLGPFGPLIGAGAGLAFGAEQASSIGTASGSRASGLAERHARILDPANEGDPVKIANDKLSYDGRGHHYEYPEGKGDNKIFSWKSGLAGTIIGAGAGALIGHEVAGMTIIHAVAVAMIGASVAPAIAPILAGALVFGLLGLTFGIERGLFKNVFNKISSLAEGKFRNTPNEMGMQQSLSQETGDELLNHRLRRQEQVYNLRTQYDEKIFSNSMAGYAKGASGGALIGGVFGALAGLVAVGILVAATGGIGIGIAAIVGLFAAGGALYGIKTFGEAGYEAGAESTARTIDDEFQAGQSQKERGQVVSEPALPEPKKGLIATSFDALMRGVSKLSGESKELYNSVYDNEAQLAQSAMDATSQPQPNYNNAITQADTEKLNEKLNMGDKRNFADMIAQSQTTPQNPAPTL